MKKAILKKLAIRNKNVTAGANLHVGPFSRIWSSQSLQIGSDVYIGKYCTIEVDGVIGDGVLIANSVGIIGRRDHDYRQVGVPLHKSRWVGDAAVLSSLVNIESDVWIGYGATILAPVRVGFGAIVAAGAVVVEDIPEFAIVAGVPAKVIGRRFDSDKDCIEHKERLKALGLRCP